MGQRAWATGAVRVGVVVGVLLAGGLVRGEGDPPAASLSDESEACVDCHQDVTPGIVADWQRSRHARVTPEQALAVPPRERRVSAAKVPADMAEVAVGCYECHGQRPEEHADTFTHMDAFEIHPVVTPKDCQTCHPTEAKEFDGSKKAHAVDNLDKNPVFRTLVTTMLEGKTFDGETLRSSAVAAHTRGQTCFGCHGTRVKVVGSVERKTAYGTMSFPKLEGWPNQGVGRVNPDGSRGACTACHPRHSFDIEIARKPETCRQCHLEPDVPAYNVYMESKHGNIYASKKSTWRWDAVPWVVGRDLTAPTCATCHASLVTTPGGEVAAERTHDYGARLWVRIFGLPYAHPQPKHGATYTLRNADGQPLPTTFLGVPAATGLIDPPEQARRRAAMGKLCKTCHGGGVVEGHLASLDTAIRETNAMTLASTKLMQKAWALKLADPTNPFDEPLEQKWVRQWLFYSSSVRYAAAMGGPDYASLKNGWWQLNETIRVMEKEVKAKTPATPTTPTAPPRAPGSK